VFERGREGGVRGEMRRVEGGKCAVFIPWVTVLRDVI
jgi:hypothetical protein